ncbi:carboxypeptidase M32 [Pelagicoccus sp. SDUM812005]|uniref:carboxypeptidase M32 n=1 Tax=Pelagicoccus sp. SDUM812005 TaxID=3041257 RepID=UPI00280F6F4E|nr:carboxypeptidase M32 [Pelagicoccus sp. SDUM812005]MDQ8182993.1 carboxypeptidase M32 [Pelagicoccus sp. SDUM812005]
MTPLEALSEKQKRIHSLESIAGLLGWDEQTFLPPGSADQRQNQNATLAAVIHEAKTDPEIGKILGLLENSDSRPKDKQAAVLRDARIDYDRATKLPAAYVEKHARLSSEAYHAWAAARKNNDFASYAPYLQQHLDLAKQGAEYLGWGDRPYDLQIDLHDPGMDAKTIDRLFSELKAELVPIVQQIIDSPVKARTDIFKGFPVEQQKSFLEEVTASLGFNYKRGRIDISLHPFCSGNGADTRMTTRFDVDNPLDSLFSSIHETGHGMYEQGLPLDSLHNALGKAAGMGAHESQSRLWENQVCRSRAFWEHYEPKFRAAFPQQLDGVAPDDLYLAINSVSKNPIRVDSDEVTYNLHIIIRFEIEKKLFSGELAVKDLPSYWNEQYKQLLNIEPRSDAEGVLQDVHWSAGAFGYFPSYCLGNMLAAQLWYSANEQLPDLQQDFAQGNFSRLLEWLRTNVHAHGARYRLMELSEKATGQALSPQALIRYLKERYLPLYT